MPKSTDELIAALDAFNADTHGDNCERALYDTFEGFDALPDRVRAVPAMFSVLERWPDADLGTPGPLVHAIESCQTPQYEALLIESIRRQPVEYTLWMVNRILNSNLSPLGRTQFLDLMKSATTHPKAAPHVKERAGEYLKYQAQRRAK